MKFSWMKWHRRIGITSALFVFTLSVTGFFLLLSEPLQLNQIKLQNRLISKIYHTSAQGSPVGFEISREQWVVMIDDLVYVGATDPISMSPPLIGASLQEDGLIAFSNGDETIVTLQNGILVERLADHTLTAQIPATIPNDIQEEILARYRGRGVSASRVMLDIHTGSVFGIFGPWIMGLASLFLMALSISGVIMWTGLNRRKRKRVKSL